MKRYPPRSPRNSGGWPDRDRAAQARFRRGVLAASDGRCSYIDEHGERCTVSGAENLVAHHLDSDSNDPTTGVAVCRRHHAQIDPHAR